MPRPVANPPNPWLSTFTEWLGEPPAARLEVFEERARSLVTENTSPDVPFKWGVNPYRGCFHGCAYCYARPSHQYLDWGAGTDFERKIVAKVNAPDLLRAHFDKRSWRGETVTFSGVTDCYQPLEASYALTRGCLEVCAAYGNPVGIVTKGLLIRRDAALLGRLAREAAALVYVSGPFIDAERARKAEPFVPSPAQRLETLSVLADAGVPTGVAIAPVIPGLNDADLGEILQRAREAGATRAFHIALRLPAEVRPVFEERLRAEFPERAERVLHAIREIHGGRLNDPRFGSRMRGSGARWEAIDRLFAVQCRKLGFVSEEAEEPRAPTFRRPSPQGELFA